MHFKTTDFTVQFPGLTGQNSRMTPRLLQDDIGVSVYPTIHANVESTEPKGQSMKERERRMSMRTISMVEESEACDHEEEIINDPEITMVQSSSGYQDISIASETDVDVSNNSTVVQSEPTVDELHCKCCRINRNKVLTLRERLAERRKEIKALKKKSKEKKVFHRKTQTELVDDPLNNEESVPDHDMNDSDEDWVSDDDGVDGDDDMQSDEEYHTETETETETENEHNEPLTMKDKDLRTEPKFIVFLSKLLLLFQFCHVCKDDNPLVEVTNVGTEVVVTTTCKNEKCPKKENIWRSQPTIPGHDVSAGNFLLCMAILFAGGSASKVFRIFTHMGLCCISLNTFFKHQRTKLFPAIHIYWQKCQAKMIEMVKSIPGDIVMAGDCRHDSMGHSAKYGAYTIFCCTLPMIIHFSLVQRNEAGSSPAIEMIGFERCMDFIMGSGIEMKVFISDRHTGIQKHMRVTLSHITHYFDLWHLKKKIRKVLTKISKEKNGETVKPWIKACENHLYWSAMSTYDGNGKVIWAKFVSFLSHVIDKHERLDDPLFDKCAHGDIQPRTWLDKDSNVYEKVKTALTKDSLQKGIMQASPLSQTSSLEGFHSVLNHFSPKMIHFSHTGMYCRHILSVVHFNQNLHREVQKRGDGQGRIKVVYPKFKNGEATVRDVKVQQNFGYVEEIYSTFLAASKEDLAVAGQMLKEMMPEPMTTSFLEKESREAAVDKRNERRGMVVQDVPPTKAVDQAQQEMATHEETSRKKPACKSCKKPMKGHDKIECDRLKNAARK